MYNSKFTLKSYLRVFVICIFGREMSSSFIPYKHLQRCQSNDHVYNATEKACPGPDIDRNTKHIDCSKKNIKKIGNFFM
jgi:hypothetical protein